MNPAPTPIPDSWRSSPPHLLVVGERAYASALAQVLEAACIRPVEIAAEPAPNEGGGYPKVLGALERMFLVAGTGQTAADLLLWHEAVWDWVCKLSPDGDQHELAVAWLVPPRCGASLGEGILTGLGLCETDAPAAGHALIPIDAPLAEILATVARITPSDLPPFRARLASDQRHGSLRALRRALEAGDGSGIGEAAAKVLEVFAGREYLLDLFSRPPSHPHGKLLRTWLNRLVTGEGTPQNAGTIDGGPLSWLDGPRDTTGT